ncbi:penicillinase repressor [Glaciihabitans tibetensis]|uniref:Penicillinase repressor n=1 Tax=Glaciihabitans tibetensis TaxID=1266600 RepID=A0A2T0VAP0_9MICO|nr:BlaI/MecI/CopY family transcriptional regulator [Glaciihabitans tibetensis]PRY67223.1 penicillinase repressor [Glaciihabitans tibetensis]
MVTLGELERSVMDILWESPRVQTLSAYELQDRLATSAPDSSKKLAATTILTVLSRLEKKGFVERERASRPHRYRSAASREDHMAELMHEVLGGASNRVAVLERFIGQASSGETDMLRKLLESSGR